MKTFVLIGLLLSFAALAEELSLIGVVVNDGGYELAIEDTNVTMPDEVAEGANLAQWVGRQVEIRGNADVEDVDGARRIHLTSIASVVENNDED